AEARDCALAGAALARMHTVERMKAGGVREGVVPRERYPHRAILPNVRRYASKIDSEMPTVELAFFGTRTGEWFWRRSVEILESGAPFALCHNALTPDHVWIGEAKAWLLDFTRAAFGLPGLDLGEALLELGGDSDEAARALADAYFAASSSAQWARFHDGFDFFVAMTALKRLHDQLARQTEGRRALDPQTLARVAARAMQGNIQRPAAPNEAGERFHALFFEKPAGQRI
ncbi:MAG: hypothetical protein NTW86_31510, partial [Candidatus Sumerlaeota bacterium]|nr:hypothetical protein [Candidatus Sumerlaeota bacterium]